MRPGLSILIVEDDRLTAASLVLTLTRAGHTVVGVAHDGVTALRLAEEHRPSIALCDVDLGGGLSGVTVGQELAAQGIAVIYATAHVPEAVLDGRDHAVDFINKPFSDQTLLAAIDKALRRAKPEE